MVDDFGLYHLAMAVIGTVLGVVLVVLSVVFRTRFRRTVSAERRARRVWASFGALWVSLLLFAILPLRCGYLTGTSWTTSASFRAAVANTGVPGRSSRAS
jgi:hypothetical protein